MKTTPSGLRANRLVTIQNPGAPAIGSDGTFTQTWTNADPSWLGASIRASGPGTSERTVDGTVTANATHVITVPFHKQITTQTRLISDTGQTFSVTGVTNVDDRDIELQLFCVALETTPLVPPAATQDWVAEGWY